MGGTITLSWDKELVVCNLIPCVWVDGREHAWGIEEASTQTILGYGNTLSSALQDAEWLMVDRTATNYFLYDARFCMVYLSPQDNDPSEWVA